jgi:iron complex outermembrane recepter protein
VIELRKKIPESSIPQARESSATGERPTSHFGCLALCWLVLLLWTAAAQSETTDASIEFNIPRQRADIALNEFADQAGRSLVYPYEEASNTMANRLVGNYPIVEGLEKLLLGTGLHIVIGDQGQFSVSSDLARNGENDSMNKNKSVFAVLMGLFAGAGAASPATAQVDDVNQARNSGPALEEVVVIARMREENLQEVPASIVVMSSDLIQRSDISAARDVTVRVPNVSIVESLSPTSTYIFSRGVGATRNSEPAVSLIIDGVQVGSATEISQSFYDVEQIELLKGPQGSLYGRNALGGALVVTSKKPSDQFEGRINAGAGGDGLVEIGGSVAGPITDTLSYRLSGNFRDFDGTIENEYLPGSGNEMDFEKNRDYRGQLFWEPGDNTSVNLRYSKNDFESGSMWYRNIYRMETDENAEYEFPINSNGNPTAYVEIDTFTLKVDHDIDSLGTFTSISNYTDTSERYGRAGEVKKNDRTGNVLFFTEPFVNDFIDGLDNPVDNDFFATELGDWAAGNFVGSDQYYDVETFSQEFRLVSNGDQRLRYVAGAYLLLTERDDTIRATWELPFGEAFDCEPSYPGGPVITDFSSCSGLINSTENSQDNTAWALFANFEYDLTDNLVLTLAGRYDEDKREVERIDGPTVDTFGLGVGACDSVADPENCAAAGSKLDDTFSAFQPKVSLAWIPSENLTLYGTAARGFRSGGFNASGALLTDSYDKETLDSFEFGFKSVAMDGRFRSSMAAFYQDYKDVQQFEFDGNVFVQSLYNIPESEIIGLEGSFEFAATENLMLTAAFGLMDSEITKFDSDIHSKMEAELNARVSNSVKLPAGTQKAFDKNFKGYELPLFAHTTANLGFQWDLPLSIIDGRMLITRVDYSYSDGLQWWIDGEDSRDSLSLVQASVGLELMENLEIQAWCKNCTDKEYDSEFGTNERELFGGAAKDVAYQARLRTYGLRATYRF